MSMDAGGLAQMTYNNFASNGGLGMPGAGFASRGKGNQLKRLSVASPPKVASISENSVEAPTPRTSRSHLLAGLRTQPKTPTVPASAPYNQQRFGVDTSNYGQTLPQTNQYGVNAGQQVYSLPEQPLAPPSVFNNNNEDDQMDPQVAAQLVAMEIHLQHRQQQLQQQLLQLTNQQFQHMNLGLNGLRQQQYPNTPMTPHMGVYNQQMQNGAAPITQEVPGQPGLFLVYNPMTGQTNYIMDQSLLHAAQLSNSPPPPTPTYSTSPPKPDTPTFRAQITPPNETVVNPFDTRSTTPPKKAPSPLQDVTPLPPPSANAFRRGHKKVTSLSFNSNSTPVSDGPKTSVPRISGFPQTPMTGTFGPGQGRAGEHPVRQPRNPPPLEELIAKPTNRQEGSKNFATRQRRRAVHSLVRAGIERRGVTRPSSHGSMTPVSETDMNFSLSNSDNDSDSVHSGHGSLSGRMSMGSLRAAASGAIGSERKASRERLRNGSGDSYTANSVSSDEGYAVGGGLVEVRVEEPKSASADRRRMPLLLLTSAEKRKSSMF
ncbi:hypothetical protein M501DRAFT_1011941 [Patellaria atrata CBS 101060]|uniref:Uncharacterized protein n=1 Tax=Patellaria atrata CBS 101060 TaxID=1346257 RepID=A0A9P4VSB9_9PEZI|nr:hypothetical protein M501DRAFT_1011941 [Patellaria atrata CBS 101060]